MSGPAPRAYLFSGGGTGGHIFPALAIAEQLRAHGSARFLFLCSDRQLDAQILSREHEHFKVIPAKPFGLRPRAFLRFLNSWGASVREARRAITERRRAGEDVRIIAMGGFVAAPVVQAARAEKVPVLLVNMDAVPGRANRWVARHAARIVTSAPVPGEAWDLVPPIVRAAATATTDPGRCRAELGLDPHSPTLLITGASQGARSINSLLIELARTVPDAFAGWQIIHQTGPSEDDRVRDAYDAANIPALVQPFFDRMGLAWGAAELAVSRAGAGSVAEAWANGVPTLFLPYPYHRDQHQRYNAQPLAEAGAAVIAEDMIEPVRNASGAGLVLLDLLSSPDRRAAMRTALAALGPADGAARIAAILAQS